jgi:hypothetical protein
MSDLDEMTKNEPKVFVDDYGMAWMGEHGLWKCSLEFGARIFRVIVPLSDEGDRRLTYVVKIGDIILAHSFSSPQKAANAATGYARYHKLFIPPAYRGEVGES